MEPTDMYVEEKPNRDMPMMPNNRVERSIQSKKHTTNHQTFRENDKKHPTSTNATFGYCKPISCYKTGLEPILRNTLRCLHNVPQRARIRKRDQFSYEDTVHTYKILNRKNLHKFPKKASQKRRFSVLNDITNMTSSTALRNLELAEARKRKAAETSKEKQKQQAKKKSNLKNPNGSNLNKLNMPRDPPTLIATEVVGISEESAESGTKRNNKVYYTMKLVSKGGINPLKVLQQMLRDWLRTMQSCINSIVVYDTSKNGNLVISTPEQIPTNLQVIKKFFNGIQPRTGAGKVWFTTLIGYNEDEEEVLDNTKWWYQENNCVMFRKALQVLDTSRELWLMFSHDKINIKSLKESIDDTISSKGYQKVPFALVSANIRDGKKFSVTKKGEKPVKAVHIEVANEDVDHVKTLFSQLYGSSAKTFSLGI